LFSTLAFVSSGFLPSPIDKMVIGIQALCFALAALIVPKGGAIYASFITGLLLSILRPGFFPFSLLFSLFYGLIIEGLFCVFKVNNAKFVKPKRLILLLTIATAITGFVSMYYTTMIGIIVL
jgi:ABC-type thiamin/hydroxymethylpyrimidine transport system permease subunit